MKYTTEQLARAVKAVRTNCAWTGHEYETWSITTEQLSRLIEIAEVLGERRLVRSLHKLLDKGGVRITGDEIFIAPPPLPAELEGMK